MQRFSFTLTENGSNYLDGSHPVIPASTNTLDVDGDLNLTMLIEYFQQFVVGCGYVLPDNSHIGIVDEDY